MARKKSPKSLDRQWPRQPAPPPLSDTDDAFLRAIRAEHGSDTHRLVYADWLDEQGDQARAEFIRLQCELAHLDEQGERARELKEREAALLGEHRSRWTFGLDRQFSHFVLTFRRGFVEEVKCYVHRCPPEVFNVLRHHPVRKLRLHGGPLAYHPLTSEECQHLAGRAELALIRELDCPNAEDPGSLWLLLTSPHLAGLEVLRLKLDDCTYTTESRKAMEVLADSPLLARLTRLDLGENWIGAEALDTLLSAPQFAVRELGLRGRFEPEFDGALYYSEAHTVPCIGSGGVVVLARSVAVSDLACLDLVYNNLDMPAIEALLQSPHLDGVGRLVLGEFENAVFEAHKDELQTRFGTRLEIRSFPCPPVW
jgi:uncharacterized protein (TIGR02996 family)